MKSVKLKGSWLPRHEDVWGSGDIAPAFLTSTLDGGWVVSFTPRPLYTAGSKPPVPIGRKLDGRQSRSGCCGSREESCIAGTQSRAFQPVARRDTELSRLICKGKTGGKFGNYYALEGLLMGSHLHLFQNKTVHKKFVYFRICLLIMGMISL
jgi:hypothetical protein